jgi:hypothetical protein
MPTRKFMRDRYNKSAPQHMYTPNTGQQDITLSAYCVRR